MKFKPLFSALLLCVFTVNQTATAFPVKPETSKPLLPVNAPGSARSLLNVKLPKTMGMVQEVFRGSKDQTVLIVQDAHSIPEAQENIRAILNESQKQAGVRLVALEGATGELDTQIFKSFPDKKKMKEVLQYYQNNGELAGGASAALWDETPAVYAGLEDAALFEQGVGLYLKSLQNQTEISLKITSLEKQLGLDKEKAYTPELFKADRELENYYGKRSDFLTVLQTLASIQAPDKGSPLALILNQASRPDGETESLAKEVSRIADQVKKVRSLNGSQKVRREFNENYQAFKTSQMDSEAFAAYLAVQVEKLGLQISFSDALKKIIEMRGKIRDIEGTQFFKDFESYAAKVKDGQIKDEKQKALDEATLRLRWLKKMNRLEMSFEEGRLLGTDALAAWNPAQKEILESLKTHRKFYETAKQREEIFSKKLFSLMPQHESKTAAVVAGGFHAQGLTRELRRQGISYVLVMPQIRSLPGTLLYQEHMKGNVSWKNYLRVENGRVSLYDAFVRAARDRLIESHKPQDPDHKDSQILQKWRDQLIRDLLNQGRIADLKEYSRFLDEISERKEDPLLAKWKAGIRRLVDGMKRLDEQGALNDNGIRNLLKGAANIAPAASPSILNREYKAPAKLFGLVEDLLAAGPARPSLTVPSELLMQRSEMRIQETVSDAVNRLLASARFFKAQMTAAQQEIDTRKEKIRGLLGSPADAGKAHELGAANEETQTRMAGYTTLAAKYEKAAADVQAMADLNQFPDQKAWIDFLTARNIVSIDQSLFLKTYELNHGWLAHAAKLLEGLRFVEQHPRGTVPENVITYVQNMIKAMERERKYDTHLLWTVREFLHAQWWLGLTRFEPGKNAAFVAFKDLLSQAILEGKEGFEVTLGQTFRIFINGRVQYQADKSLPFQPLEDLTPGTVGGNRLDPWGFPVRDVIDLMLDPDQPVLVFDSEGSGPRGAYDARGIYLGLPTGQLYWSIPALGSKLSGFEGAPGVEAKRDSRIANSLAGRQYLSSLQRLYSEQLTRKIQRAMALPDVRPVVLVINASFSQTYQAAVNLFNSGRKQNTFVLHGLPSAVPQFLDLLSGTPLVPLSGVSRDLVSKYELLKFPQNAEFERKTAFNELNYPVNVDFLPLDVKFLEGLASQAMALPNPANSSEHKPVVIPESILYPVLGPETQKVWNLILARATRNKGAIIVIQDPKDTSLQNILRDHEVIQVDATDSAQMDAVKNPKIWAHKRSENRGVKITSLGSNKLTVRIDGQKDIMATDGQSLALHLNHAGLGFKSVTYEPATDILIIETGEQVFKLKYNGPEKQLETEIEDALRAVAAARSEVRYSAAASADGARLLASAAYPGRNIAPVLDATVIQAFRKLGPEALVKAAESEAEVLYAKAFDQVMSDLVSTGKVETPVTIGAVFPEKLEARLMPVLMRGFVRAFNKGEVDEFLKQGGHFEKALMDQFADLGISPSDVHVNREPKLSSTQAAVPTAILANYNGQVAPLFMPVEVTGMDGLKLNARELEFLGFLVGRVLKTQASILQTKPAGLKIQPAELKNEVLRQLWAQGFQGLQMGDGRRANSFTLSAISAKVMLSALTDRALARSA